MNLFLWVFLENFIIFFYMCIYLMYFAQNLGLNFLAPQGVVGIFILLVGFIFSIMMFYVGYISIREMYSITSSSDQILNAQKEKIARLYPQSSDLGV